MKDLGNFGGAQAAVDSLNRGGEVTGWMTLAGEKMYHAFLWNGAKLIDLTTFIGALGGDYAFANSLNDAGAVVGQATFPGDQTEHAVLWQDGVTTDLGTLKGDPCSEADSINSHGQIVGASQSAAGGCNFYTSAFLWENGGPSVDLNDLVSPHSSLLLTGASWINDEGEITGGGAPVGCGDTDICGHAFLLIPCDENHPGIEGCNYSLVDAATQIPSSELVPSGMRPLGWPRRNRYHLRVRTFSFGIRGSVGPRRQEFKGNAKHVDEPLRLKEKKMKSKAFAWISAMTSLAALAMPVQPAAQDSQDHNNCPKHHHYKLVDPGTFGGPLNYINGDDLLVPSVSPAHNVNRVGTLTGWADTSISDPYGPNYCFNGDCFVSHAFRWREGSRTDLGVLPGGSNSASTWISANGLVVGTSQNGRLDPYLRAFRRTRPCYGATAKSLISEACRRGVMKTVRRLSTAAAKLSAGRSTPFPIRIRSGGLQAFRV